MSKEDKSDSVDSLPRPGSALYNMNNPDEKTRKKTLRRFKLANKYFTIPFYRLRVLPLIGMGRIFLLLITKGRKSKKKRISPLEYHRIDGVIHIFSGRGEKADWVKNMRKYPDDVKVLAGFRWFNPKVDIIENTTTKVEIMDWYVRKNPRAAKMLVGWDPKRDSPETIDMTPLADLITIVRLHRRE
ncbi:MAG: nitroreductase/quinone reductase family protein [Promethearchaeota archaeon]